MYKEKKCNNDYSKDNVRLEYKRYKKKKPPPDFSDVIDFNNPVSFESKIKRISLDLDQYGLDQYATCKFCTVGLKHPSEWNVYEVKSCPGFIVVTNPFLSYKAQSYWVKQALTTYTKAPYPCNLDVLMKLDKTKDLWEISRSKSCDNSFINQLRWVHMGYHFDYNNVDYKLKEYFGFPEDLKQLTTTIACVFQYSDYAPETGIINYYPEGSSMGGHTDHYEEELRQPLISYSFGQSAVYLIGGQTRDVTPEGIWVRSGDVMLMTGQSRTAFHAVPCILTKPVKSAPPDIGTCPLVLGNENECVENGDSKDCPIQDHEHLWNDEMKGSWNEFSKYISGTRININIRQVHKYKGN